MEYDKQIRYNDSQMERYQAYISKVQKIKRLDKRTKETTIGDVIKKSILPLTFMVFWFWMTKTIMKVSGQTDWFWWIFIAGLPFGIHKMRLILIPRGMDTTATLVILDEASAYADPENEVYIEEAINELVKDKTLIVVAHRLETIENSDKIVVVDQGKIVAEGTQSELLKNCALYKRLWNETILTSERKRGECNA